MRNLFLKAAPLVSRDGLTGVFMIASGLLLLTLIIPHWVTEPSKVRVAALAPSYYPRLVAVCLALIGAAILSKVFLGKAKPAECAKDRRPNAMLRTTAILSVLTACFLSLEWLGFVLGPAITVALALLLGGERRFWLIGAISLLLPFLLYLFFLKIARIPIPAGLLQPHIGNL